LQSSEIVEQRLRIDELAGVEAIAGGSGLGTAGRGGVGNAVVGTARDIARDAPLLLRPCESPAGEVLPAVATVPLAGLRAYVGTVSDDVMWQVRGALLFALGFGAPERAPTTRTT